jgi:hypothetical protein
MKRHEKLRKSIDPLALFKHAYRIWAADLRLRNKESPVPPAEIAHGSMVLNAFASELFLKCLLIIEQGDAPSTHRLDILFRRVSHNRKRRIEELWNEHCKSKVMFTCRQFGLPADLPNAIVKCGDAFERLRYHYEDPEKTIFYLHDLPWAVGKAILEIKPEWHQRMPRK